MPRDPEIAADRDPDVDPVRFASRQKSRALQTLDRSRWTRSNAATWRASFGAGIGGQLPDPAQVPRPQRSSPRLRPASRSRPNWRSGSRRRNRSLLSSARRLSTDFSTRDPTSPGDVLGIQAVTGTHRLGRVELEPAGEHGQARPQQPLGLAQEPVAPVDRSLERLLPRGCAPVAGAQGAEPGREPAIERVEAEGVEPDGRELERQWDAVEPRADAQDRGGVRGVDARSRAGRPRRARRTGPPRPSGGGPPAGRRRPRAATAWARR